MKKTPAGVIILHVHQKSWSYDVYFLRYEVRQNFLQFWAIFPFTSLATWKVKILKNWKKAPVDIILLHICTTNENHMIYGSWDMRCNRHGVLSFWAIFVILPPPLHPDDPKNQNFQKMKKNKKIKKCLEILFYICVLQMKIIWCMVPGIWGAPDRRFCHFGPFLPFYPPPSILITHKIKIFRKWRK